MKIFISFLNVIYNKILLQELKCYLCILCFTISIAFSQDQSSPKPLSAIVFRIHSDTGGQAIVKGITNQQGEWKFQLTKNGVYNITFFIPDKLLNSTIDSGKSDSVEIKYALTSKQLSFEKVLTKPTTNRNTYSDAFLNTVNDSIEYSGRIYRQSVVKVDTLRNSPDSLHFSQEGAPTDTTMENRNATISDSMNSGEAISVEAVQAPDVQPSELTFLFNGSTGLGVTFSSRSQESSNDESLDWGLNVQAECHVMLTDFLLDTKVIGLLGQSHSPGNLPVVTQNNLTLSLMPSIKFLDSPSLRLFYQVNAETFIKEGFISDRVTRFFDPAFVTHTLFVGDKSYPLVRTEDEVIELVYGLGYAFTHIIKQEFEFPEDYVSANSNNTDMGLSAVFNVSIQKSLSSDMRLNVSFSSNALALEGFYEDAKNARFSSILIAGFNYQFISISYNNRIVYDRMLSEKRVMEQSLVLGVNVNF